MYFVNDRNFYPTPVQVIEQMMQGEDVANKVVLEPSAGSGNIVKWCEQRNARQVLAVEPVDVLRDMLGRTSAELIGYDFKDITPAQVSHVDYIIMNPPFTHDEEHLRHAWDIAPAGCTIVALMPTNTFANAYTERRRALGELVKLHGMRRDIGDVFNTSEAERRTDCPVSVIKLYKEGKGENEFAGYFFASHDEDAAPFAASGVMTYDAVRDLVNRYKMAVEQFDLVMQQAEYINSLANFAQMLTPERRKECGWDNSSPAGIRFGASWCNGEKNTQQITRDVYKRQLQKDAWRFVFSLLNLGHMATNKLREQINQFVEEQTSVPFTMRNIYRMLEIVVKTNGQRMDSCLTDAFDIICSFSADNSTAGEGWKTNSDYMVNRRFILPNVGGYDARWPQERVTCGYSCYDRLGKMDDVIKALCHLTGEPLACSWGLRRQIEDKRAPWGEWFEVGQFFRCRVYKKGTAHFEFLSEDVWAKFNARVAQIKGWRIGSRTSKTSTSSRNRRK